MASPASPERMSGVDEAAGVVEASSPTGSLANHLGLTDQTRYVQKSTIITVFLTVSTADLMALMDQTTLAASLFIISRALNADSQSAWISGAYFLTSSSFQLCYGRVSDIFGRKAALLSCMAVFFIGSLASSLAQTAAQLIAFRAITGVGGGGLMTIAQTAISDVCSLRDRGKYQGILGAVVAIANGIGPIVGAAISVQGPDSWRWIFRVNLFLVAISTVMVVFALPLKKVEGSMLFKLKAIDYGGVVLTLTSSTCLVLGLTWADAEYPWVSAAVLVPLFLGIAIFAGFVIWEGCVPRFPLMPLSIWKSKITVGACLTMFINGWLFVAQVYYIPAFFQLAYGLSPVLSGALLLPITLMQTVSSTLSGLIVSWVGRYRESILVGWVLWAIGLGLFSTLDQTHFSVGKAVGFGLLTGIGVGQTLQPSLIAIQAGVERASMAAVTCTRNFVRNVGSMLGLAIGSTIINSALRSTAIASNLPLKKLISNPQAVLDALPPTEREGTRQLILTAYSTGFRNMFYLMSGLASLGAVVAWCLIPQIGLDRPDEEALKAERDRKGS